MSSDSDEPKFPFKPTPLRPRHDGWTAEKQIAFIEALAESGCVEEACRQVGMSDSAAYKLRRRPCGAPFREAWEAALDYAIHRVEEGAVGRTRHGVPRPIFHKGEQVGEWRHFDERLTMFLLRSRRPQRYGKWIDRMLLPDEEDAPEDPAIRLDAGLQRIEWEADNFPDEEEPEPPDGDESSGSGPDGEQHP